MVDDFITRSKLGPRLDIGCKQKAEKERNEGDNKNLSLEEITANNREEFGRSARGYVVYLVGATHKLSRFTSDIVRGLGSFDLEVLLVDPVEQAMYCFKQLFSSFRLVGSWTQEKSQCTQKNTFHSSMNYVVSIPVSSSRNYLLPMLSHSYQVKRLSKPDVASRESFAFVAFAWTNPGSVSLVSDLIPRGPMILLQHV